MSVDGQTLSLFAGALKRDYHGPITDSLNNMTALYRILDKEEEGIEVSGEGLTAYAPIKTRRTQGIGSVAEGGPLPTARQTKILQLEIGLAYCYGAIQFTGQSIKASQKSATAFAKVVDLEINDMVEAIKIDTNRQFFGDSTGVMCLTNGTGGQSTVTVDTPGTQYLEEGMPILTDASSDGTTGAASSEDISHGLTESTAHIVKKILTSTTFMLGTYADVEESAEQWHTDHYMFRYLSPGNEMMGLKGIIDNEAIKATSSWDSTGNATTTIHGKSRSSYGILDATINHNSNTDTNITEIRIQGLLDDIEQKAGKKDNESNLILMTTYGVRKAYVDLLQSDRRYVKPLELVGGWQAIAYQSGSKNIPIIVDRHCLNHAMLAIDRRYVKIYRASNFDWMDMDGSMFQRKIDSSGRYDSYEAMLYAYMALGCTSFPNQGALRDITEE